MPHPTCIDPALRPRRRTSARGGVAVALLTAVGAVGLLAAHRADNPALAITLRGGAAPAAAAAPETAAEIPGPGPVTGLVPAPVSEGAPGPELTDRFPVAGTADRPAGWITGAELVRVAPAGASLREVAKVVTDASGARVGWLMPVYDGSGGFMATDEAEAWFAAHPGPMRQDAPPRNP